MSDAHIGSAAVALVTAALGVDVDGVDMQDALDDTVTIVKDLDSRDAVLLMFTLANIASTLIVTVSEMSGGGGDPYAMMRLIAAGILEEEAEGRGI